MVLIEESIKDMSPQDRAAFITDALKQELSKDLHDQFEFEVKQSIPIGDLEPENLAAIALIDVELAGEKFCKMRIDVGVTDSEGLPGEHGNGRNLHHSGLRSISALQRSREAARTAKTPISAYRPAP